jgi:hypothetical protein
LLRLLPEGRMVSQVHGEGRLDSCSGAGMTCEEETKISKCKMKRARAPGFLRKQESRLFMG